MTFRLPALLRYVGLAAVCMVCATPPASAQETFRSGVVPGSGPDKTGPVGEGRFVFAGVGINSYQTPTLWKELDNAVNDVERVRTTLVERYGFDAPDPLVLTDDEATTQNIRDLLDALRRDLQPDDNLVFFYAGHGAEVRDVVAGEEVGRTGYLVPVDVKGPAADYASQYLGVEALLEALAKVPARHVLVILDACYSGIALQQGLKMRGGEEPRVARDLVSRVSRRVLTSAQSDQLAADGGADFPKNSLFTGWLVEGLERAAQGRDEGTTPDADADGLITGTELYTFLQGRVASASGSRQTPDFGAFKLDQRGDLILALERDPFDEYYRAAVEAFEAGDFAKVSSDAKSALDLRPEGAEAAYLRYLSGLVAEDNGKVLEGLRQMAALSAAGASVPLSTGALTMELRRTEALCRKTGCTPGQGN